MSLEYVATRSQVTFLRTSLAGHLALEGLMSNVTRSVRREEYGFVRADLLLNRRICSGNNRQPLVIVM